MTNRPDVMLSIKFKVNYLCNTISSPLYFLVLLSQLFNFIFYARFVDTLSKIGSTKNRSDQIRDQRSTLYK